MNSEDFKQYSDTLFAHCQELLSSKVAEYASDEDRLQNFYQPTSLFNTNPACICLYYDAKHISSLVKIAQDIDKGIFPTEKLLLEKCSDYINYGVLFFTIVEGLLLKQKHDDNPLLT